MAYVFRLGPTLTTDVGVGCFYFAVDDDPPELIDVQAGRTDDEGLSALAPFLGNRPVQVERSLRNAAKKFGFQAGPLPQYLLPYRAGMALRMAFNPFFNDLRPLVVEQLAESTRSFCRAQPWERWDEIQILHVVAEHGREREFEGCIFGAMGLEYGIALFEPGEMQRAIERRAQGINWDWPDFESIAVTIFDEPEFAIAAAEDAFAEAIAPVPIEFSGGVTRPIEDEADALVLAAAMRAVAAIGRGERTGEGEAWAHSMFARVRVEAPEPALAPLESN